MRVIIAGSRDLDPTVDQITGWMQAAGFKPTLVISGTARGVDRAGERWAKEKNIPVKRMPAHWDHEGRIAGYLRNKRMAEAADALLAVWDGHSKGTFHMIGEAKGKGLMVCVVKR